MQIHRSARDTLTAVEMNHGEELHFRRMDGEVVLLKLLDTGAEIMSTTLHTPGIEEPAAMTTFRFWADVDIAGTELRIEREVGTQASFYEPVEIAGVRLWLDCVEAIFGFMTETHSPCRPQANAAHGQPPRRQARFALQDATLRLCPERLHPWCPLPEGGLRIEDCYRGEDCWLGAFDGASAHGGLDINHPSGTPLYAPLRIDDHYLYNSVAMGHNNNRWRGHRRWDNGSEWILTSCHMNHLTVPEREPIPAGALYADGAGVWSGDHDHTHFAFAVFEFGELIRLDPWILFWQMYRDQAEFATPIKHAARRRAAGSAGG